MNTRLGEWNLSPEGVLLFPRHRLLLWCFGLHDRPWTERPIFGMIRYMNLAGMQRKTNVRAYIDSQLTESLL